jgi:uncharacterized membrane protein
MEQARTPSTVRIGMDAPFRWLGEAWRDLWRAPLPFLAYGAFITIISVLLSWALYVTNLEFWVLVLTAGYVFVAPMLAMGCYEGGRILEQGRKPTLRQLFVVRSAFRQDVAYLGLALLMIYFLWTGFAQIVYGASTYRLYKTMPEIIAFAVGTSDGLNMLTIGSLIGGITAYFTFVCVVVSAPMLLDPRANVFSATATSFNAVTSNPAYMTIWAAIIAVLILVAAMSGFLLLVIIFPWLGLASWRAYRELVPCRS